MGLHGKRSPGVLGLLVTVLVAAWAPAAAHADLTWSSTPQDLSPTGTNSQNVHVATDAAGDAVAVWLQHDSSANVDLVWEARRPAGGVFGQPIQISNPQAPNESHASSAVDPAVAMNARGDVIVVWDQFAQSVNNGGGAKEIYYSWEPAGRPWAPVQATYTGAEDSVNPQVGLDSAGNADLVWLYDPTNSTGFQEIVASYRPAGDNSQFGQLVQLTTCPICNNNTGIAPEAPQLAMNAGGDALVTFLADYAPNTISPDVRVVTQFLPAGGPMPPAYKNWPHFGAETPISPPGSTIGVTVSDPSPAIDAAGNGLVVFEQGVASGTPHTKAAYRPKSQGTFNLPAQTLSTPQYSYSPRAAFDPSGDAFAIWSQSQDPTAPGPKQIVTAYRPAGASSTFGAPVGISSPVLTADDPLIGVDGQGRPAATWVATDSGGADIVQGSSRNAGPGPWAAPADLSAAGDLALDTAGPPDFSVSSSGQSVVGWQSSDGGELIAHATFGTPPESKPPPPPPPPPPPIPEAINAAAPFERGRAIVLTANVKGDATRLEWDFSGPNPKIDAGIVDGQLQRSVRLRPDTRNFTVKVTAFGPGGSDTYSRTFLLPKPLSDPTDQQAQHAIDNLNAAPVFAVGNAQDLLGSAYGAAGDGGGRANDSGCGQITVYSAVQTLSGCMRPANVLNNIPPAERGFIAPLADQLGIDASNTSLVQDAISQMDGYVSAGKTVVNDNWPVVPNAGAQLVSFAQARQLTSSSASLEVAGQQFGLSRNGFSMKLDPKQADIPLGDLPRPPKLPSIGGFELTGDWNIDLQKRTATITASLKLPTWLTSAGINIQNSVTLLATPDRLILQDVSVGPISVDIGGLGVQDFKISYDESQDEWTGQGKACIIPQACLDMVPPNGEIKIKHGQLDFAGASLDFPLPGIPLFPGVNLERIGFGLGLDPTRLTGNGRISVLRIVKLDGRMVAAFPSDRTPFYLRADEVGSGFPARLYGVAFTRPTLGGTAAVIVSIPGLGDLELGHGYLLYQYPSYISVGGGIDQKLFDFLGVSGDINGEANFDEGTINLHGDVQGCVNIDGWQCAGAVANVSHAPNNGGGAGACLDIGGLHIGGGIQWAHPFDPIIWPFDGCKWSRFAVTVSASSAAAITRQTIKVRRGGPNQALKIYGQGAAPLVHVSGPGGQQLDSSASGIASSAGGRIRLIGYHGAQVSFTVVGLEHARPGLYTITPLPGSVPFLKVARATDLPDARARATVSGSGLHRVLHYHLLSRPGQVVHFLDLAEGGSARSIGRVRGGGSGELRFSPAPGRRRHQIVAQFTLQGLDAERLTLTSFRPPPPRLQLPAGLHLSRHGRTLVVSWRRVPDAVRYEIAVTAKSGLQRIVATRGTTAVFKHVAAWLSGVVTVEARDALRRSDVARHAFKGSGSAPRVFSSLPHCHVTRRRITCPGYKFHHHPHRGHRKH